MPLRSTIPVLALAVAGCSWLAGCGGEESNPQLLPEKHADFLLENLEQAEEAFAANDCETVEARLEDALERINDLGAPPISKPLKLRLREGVQALQDEAGTCGEEEEPTDTTEPADPEPTPVPEPEPEPQPEPEPEPEPEPQPEPEPEPEPQPEPQEPVEPAPTPPGGGTTGGGGATGPPVTPGGGGISPSDQVGGA